MILISLIDNIALVVALSAILPLVGTRWGRDTVWGRVISGLLFGVVTLIGMLTPVSIGNGVIFDGRSVVLCAAGVLGGPIVAGIAAVLPILYRLYLGGAGASVGVLVAIEAAGIGSVAYYLRQRDPRWSRLRNLYAVGLLVHVVMVLILATLPGAVRGGSFDQIMIIVLIVHPLATAALCWFLLEDELRLATRAALALSEERLKLALDGSLTGLWDWNVKTGKVEINDRWAEIVGMTRTELEPMTPDGWMRMIHPDDAEATQRALDDHLHGVSPFYRAEFRMRHKDGHWVWVVARGTVVQRDPLGNPVRMAGSHIEISDRKADEEALRQSHLQLEQMVLDVAEAMGRAVEARDPYTQGHEQRVADLARAIALRMGMGEREADGIEMAGLLHDIGKLRVPAEILTKPGQLSSMEFALIKEHPRQGYEILKDIAFPWPIAETVLQHHERLDGSGYPHALSGDDILPSSRILAVADVVEAMASHRPYRPALGLEAAIAELSANPEKFDQRVVTACLELCEGGLIEL